MKLIISLASCLMLGAVLVTGCSGSAKPFTQTGSQIETRQPEQDVSELKITAEGAPVEVRLSDTGQYRYEYDKDKYTVTTAENGPVFEIKVAEITSGADTGESSSVVISIPNQSYRLITGISEGSSLVLSAVNANMNVTGSASSVAVSLPPDYDKTINYTGNASSCSLSLNGVTDFTVTAKISASAVSVPDSWPACDMLSPSYSHSSGNGTAAINIDVANSSFAFD